jgi:hypothetical protein
MIMQKWSYYAKINSNFQLRYTKNRYLNRFFSVKMAECQWCDVQISVAHQKSTQIVI